MKPYVSIDLETTGLDENDCLILEVGAVIDDWTSPFGLLPKFHCYVDHGNLIQGSPYALSMHPKILRRIATKWQPDDGSRIMYLEPDCVGGMFADWLGTQGIFPHQRHLTAAGKNFASFDQQFLKRLPDWVECVPIQHRSADPGNLYWDPRVDLHGLPNTKTCMKRAGIEGEVAHTAVEDAMVVVKLIRHWFNYISKPFPG